MWSEHAGRAGRSRARIRPGDAGRRGEFIARGWDGCLTALTTGLLCALRHADDPVGALARAATTSGDSDSIASLAGAFLGAAYGTAAWPPAWTGRIEYADELAALGAGWDAGYADHGKRS